MLLYMTEMNENISEDILESRMSLLCLQRLEKAIACKDKKDCIRSVEAGLLLQCGLREMLAQKGLEAEVDSMGRPRLEMGMLPNGKPFLKEYPELYFNISHSGTLIGCAFASENIGFDLQQIRSCKADRLISKFHEREKETFFSLEESLRERFFFRLWSVKEAYIKYTGNGLSESFASFQVVWEKNEIRDLHNNFLAQFQEIDLKNNDYCAAIVAKNIKNISIIMKSDI